MKIAIETKSTKEIEFSTGYFKKKDFEFLIDFDFYQITETEIIIVMDNSISKYSHAAGERYIEKATSGIEITMQEFYSEFEKTFNSIHSVILKN